MSVGTDADGVLAEIVAWGRKIEAARRVIVCRPEIEQQVRDAIAALGPVAEGLLEVRPSSACPEGRVLVMPTREQLLADLGT